MRAVLDHIGIAVRDLPAALAFYRDALGLEVEVSEAVASQRVRAHFLPVGESSLELLEATASDSAIAKYIEKRGPGLHHITLRVDDISAALKQLKAHGVRLIDEQPRPGAEAALVAFIHPSSAHGVLVELKESRSTRERGHETPARSTTQRNTRYQIGDLELTSLCDGFFGLDGGSMFGVVPKVLWSPKAPADDRNRISLATRPLLVRGVRTMLIDAGIGDKDDERFREMFAVDRARNLDQALAEAGVAPEDIDVVLATHLHWDHVGGFTTRDDDGRVRPRFPRARYVVRRGEWDVATHPNERNRASYHAQDFIPLADAGVLELVDADQTIMPGVRVQRTGGHTADHQIIWIQSGGKRAVYAADLLPTTAHLPDAWILGFDLYPMDSLAAKKAFKKDVGGETLIFLPHDPAVAAGYLAEQNGRPTLQVAQ
jgi:methylmalonyl-CoA epimerase